MNRIFLRVVLTGGAVLSVLLVPVWVVAGLSGVLLLPVVALYASAACVVPSFALARTRRWQRLPFPEWVRYGAAGLVWSLGLCLLVTGVIVGAPHNGWSVLTWPVFRDRVLWMTGVLVPAVVVTHLLVRLLEGRRARTPRS
ncbi:hypothetical protein ACFWBN_18240 [Streptomyces sp. NPDC059989]|uniref:hypothetical protein n=1 Tax=Streptomyces sp. NPDC059989 TaxID=3347026 RepID=UPI00368629D5